jgi:Tfp pilus assembly protein PilE
MYVTAVTGNKFQTTSVSGRSASARVRLFLEHGFTLVEVLISAMILFSALGFGTLAYRSSVSSVDRMTAEAEIATALPAILVKVKAEILERKGEGQGVYGDSINYTWTARKLTSAKNILNSYDENTFKPAQGSFTVSLNSVALAVSFKKNGVEKEAQYEYREFSWTK